MTIICHPENDPNIRYVLGKKGINNLLVICLNPSTATGVKHDGTTDNVEKIAAVNGYDGWVLFNLSPQRTPFPHLLDILPNEEYLSKNRDKLEAFILDPDWAIKNVWLAWGNNIMSKTYLKEQAHLILCSLRNHSLVFWHIKYTQKGHPYHPSKQSINRFIGPVKDIVLQEFDVVYYTKHLLIL
ncbi:MAG: DUF1643 domain-containing protein [Flavobacteriales bacterium]|nr:DUF1643 domain-containing protein [Flavobacteriales bacterium]